jgi:ketosteroid isomerase-like protein
MTERTHTHSSLRKTRWQGTSGRRNLFHALLGSLLATALLLPLAGGLSAAGTEDDEQAIHALLDDFHAAAADADLERYLGHFSDDAVFMGTDDWERWPIEEFRPYVAGRFEGGTGWTYLPRDRFINFDATGDLAWFDEIAVSPRWGRFRGTGVVRRTDAGWKVAHYSLTALVPNERFADVAEVTKAGFAERDSGGPNPN